jgi:orotate phosphoribosyltransferase
LDRAEKRSLEDPVSAVQAVARDMALGVISIVNLPQLQTFLERSTDYSNETLQRVIKYKNEYVVSV